MMMIRADEVNADEPVMHRNGILTEGASSNVFILRDGRLLTPALDAPRPILAGVTRQLVIEAAESLGHPVGVEDIPVEAFRTAEEAFVSSSRRLVAAITSIDGIPVHDGEPGAVTMALLRELHRRIGADTGTLQGR